MEQFIGCDAHKKFSLFIAMNQEGHYGKPIRVPHDRERRGRMESCGRLVTGPFRVAQGVRRLTSVAQLAKLPHKYAAASTTRQRCARATRNAAISWPLRTSSTSPASTG